MAASNDISTILKDLREAGKQLREAAAVLKGSGSRPIKDAMMDAIRLIATSHAYASSAAKGGIPLLSEGSGDGERKHAPQRPVESIRDALKDMAKGLATGRPAYPHQRQIAKLATSGWNKARAAFAGTRAGRLAGRVAQTRFGKAAIGMVTRTAASVGARAGASGVSGAAAGAGALGLGASLATGVGIFVGVLAVVGAALYGLGKAVDAATGTQLRAMREFEKVSSSMAMVFAQADLRDTLRNFERGERLAPSAQALSNADQKLKDNSTEIIVLLGAIQNSLLGFLESGLADLLEPLNEMARGAIEWLKRNKLLAEGEAGEAFDQFLDRVAKDGLKAMQAGDRWQDAARRDRR